MQHLILSPRNTISQKPLGTKWQDIQSIFRILVKSGQMSRASNVFKEFKKKHANYVTMSMYEDIIFGFVRQFEETEEVRNLQNAYLYYKDANKLLKDPPTPKLQATIARGLLQSNNQDHIQYINNLFKKQKLEHDNFHPTPHSSISALEQIMSDSIIKNAPHQTILKFNSILKNHNVELKNSEIDLQFSEKIKSFPRFEKKTSIIKEMPTLGVRLLKDSLDKFEENIDPSFGPDIVNMFDLQYRLEEQAYNMNFEMIEKKKDVLNNIRGMSDYSISNNFKVHSELKKIAYNWVSNLEAELHKFKNSHASTWENDFEDVSAIVSGLNLDHNLKTPNKEHNIYPILSLFKPKQVAVTSVFELIKSLQTGMWEKGFDNEVPNSVDEVSQKAHVFAKTSNLCRDIGTQLIKQYNAEMLRSLKNSSKREEGNNEIFHTLKDYDSKIKSNPRYLTQVIKKLHEKYEVPLNVNPTILKNDSQYSEVLLDLDKRHIILLGAFIVKNLIKVSKLSIPSITSEDGVEETTALFTAYSFDKQFRISVVKVHPYLNSIIMNSNVIQAVDVEMLPMLVPPKPWKSWQFGGYLTCNSPIMRISSQNEEQLNYIKEASLQNKLPVVFNSLNVLGKTPWVVNEKVLDVALKIWNSGEGVAGFPQLYEKSDIEMLRNSADSLFKKHKSEKLVRETFSLRCDLNYKLEVADRFRKFKLYFPHNIDFRGRAYPIPSYLNHINSDFSRGLLKFADKKKLGQSGWKWLKIQLANVYGYDKASFDDRAQFADDHIDDVIDSASNPLSGKKWWLEGEDPWQCLGVCFEIKDALDSGNPLEFYSNYPVHMDGSCNGLQHYAAIGGDEKGAELVNLKPQEKPADVYTMCANNVLEMVLNDLKSSSEKTRKLANFMKDKINRKLVKQTVMTTVYGVTQIGARDQVMNRLREARYDHFDDDVSMFKVATYIVKKLFDSIGTLFSNATQIQTWLNQSANIIGKSNHVDSLLAMKLITETQARDFRESVENSSMNHIRYKLKIKPKDFSSKSLGSSVIWTPPNGLTCVQPYRSAPKAVVKTSLSRFNIEDPFKATKIDVKKQSAAFPPNFIHSIDATHMMLTAIECDKLNLSFAAVHDSYWTHPGDVNEMNEVLRNCFIRIHTLDVAKKLRDEFVERYRYHAVYDPESSELRNMILNPVPQRGSFNVSQVSDSKYFFH
eukprot:NODE_54_length_30443_cov_1.442954.p2 type:complete len:1189 gc:universal NODE_54_length_30443_cov_1.442954:14189-10623(-)